MLDRFRAYARNWRLLRRAVNAVGAGCEGWPYDRLDRDAEDQEVLERVVDGHRLHFQIDRWEKRAGGDLVISIDARGLATWFGVKPSYQFVKRTDGSVYYP